MTTVRRYPDLNEDVLAVLTAAADSTPGTWMPALAVYDALPEPRPRIELVTEHLKSLARVGTIEVTRAGPNRPRSWRLKASA